MERSSPEPTEILFWRKRLFMGFQRFGSTIATRENAIWKLIAQSIVNLEQDHAVCFHYIDSLEEKSDTNHKALTSETRDKESWTSACINIRI
jgi:hypothetical protein